MSSWNLLSPFFHLKKTAAEVEAAVAERQLHWQEAGGLGDGAAPLPSWCRPSADRVASWRRSDWFRVQRDSAADTRTQNLPPPQPSQPTASEPPGLLVTSSELLSPLGSGAFWDELSSPPGPPNSVDFAAGASVMTSLTLLLYLLARPLRECITLTLTLHLHLTVNVPRPQTDRLLLPAEGKIRTQEK